MNSNSPVTEVRVTPASNFFQDLAGKFYVSGKQGGESVYYGPDGWQPSVHYWQTQLAAEEAALQAAKEGELLDFTVSHIDYGEITSNLAAEALAAREAKAAWQR